MHSAEMVAGQLSAAGEAMAKGDAKRAEKLLRDMADTPSSHVLQGVNHLMSNGTRCPFTLHFAVDGLKHAAIRDWQLHDDSAKEDFLSFPIQCLQSLDGLPPRAVEQLVHLFAVLVKLSWPPPDSPSLPDVAQRVVSSILSHCSSQTPNAMAFGASLARGVILAFAFPVAGELMLTCEQHEAARRGFQAHALPHLLHAVVAAQPSLLYYAAHNPTLPVCRATLKLLSEAILVWDFGGNDSDYTEDDA
eukprot:Sspe_Gene.42752::Locus_20795_Transcript_1_1_Confidence_1.000_Length_845::g.42752::m.42752